MDIYNAVNQMRLEHKTIYDLPLKVTFYARVSTNKEEQDGSIDNQISYFTELIKRNKNWTYIEGYSDRVRGESATNREEFQQMIEDGFNGKFDLILTKEVSRFARNTLDSLTYTRDLLRHGVGVFFQNDNICTIDGDSELRLTIMSSIAQDEVRKLSERIKFGHHKAIENGHVHGNSRIFGYDKEKARLVINEKEAEMVKMIFELYSTGQYGLRYIEDYLWDRGYRNRRGNKIHHNTISGIIQNPKYKGYYCGNKVKIVDYRTKEQKFLPPEEWVMYKDESGEIVPAIVSEELWEKANRVFVERSNKVKESDRSAKATSPLSGKIICGEHNEPFWRSSYSRAIHKGQPIYQWICRRKKRGKSHDCPTFALYESELYQILAKVIVELSENIDEYVDSFVRIYQESVSDDDLTKKIISVKESINDLENKKEKLLDLYSDDAITKSEFKSRNDKLNNEIVILNKQLAEVSEQQKKSKRLISDVRNIKSLLFKNLQNIDKNKDINKQFIDDISQQLIEKVEVFSVDKTTMRLNVVLKVGASKIIDYSRTQKTPVSEKHHNNAVCNVRSSGIIIKKMIESYENSAK